MSKKVLTIQDISCYGQCSITVALPILSAYGMETAILPSAILSTHTGGFTNFTVHDLTDEMPKIIKHWIDEGIKFDAIYTGYIGDERQFDYILTCKDKLLKENGLFIVDPAMADHGKMYYGLGEKIINGMKKICSVADYVIPNITEACFLTGIEYNDELGYNNEVLLDKLYELGAKNVILTGALKKDGNNELIGACAYDGKQKIYSYKPLQAKSYHGTGDIFSSIIVANILNNESLNENLDDATGFVVDCIKATVNDDAHGYGSKFEDVLKAKIIK